MHKNMSKIFDLGNNCNLIGTKIDNEYEVVIEKGVLNKQFTFPLV